MSLTDYIPFMGDDDPEPSELEQLRQLLADRESGLDLSAVYNEPYPSEEGEETVVFPYILLNGDDAYGRGSKEFILPDNGLSNEDSNLVQFVASRTSVAPEDVTFDALVAVNGTEADATMRHNGDIEVEV